MPDSAGLIRQGAALSHWTDERCFIKEILNDSRCPDVSVAECVVKPGVSTQWHALSVNEKYIVTGGSGSMELQHQNVFHIECGDCVQIPAGMAQRVTNNSDFDLCFLCICTPRFTPASYSALE